MRYKLHINRLNAVRPGVYKGVIKREGTMNEEDVLKYMAANHRLPLGESQAEAFLRDYSATILELLLKGYHVNTLLVNCLVSMEGNFEGPKDRFDKRRHTLKIRLKPGRLLRRAEKDMPTPKKY